MTQKYDQKDHLVAATWLQAKPNTVIGIKKDDQKHVFDKFYRTGKGDFKTVKGLGLGLYYVKQIITAHGGEIFLHSIPGKGSTFTINLPLNNEHTTG